MRSDIILNVKVTVVKVGWLLSFRFGYKSLYTQRNHAPGGQAQDWLSLS